MKKRLLIFFSVLLLLCGCNKVSRSSDLGLDLGKEINQAEETNIKTDLMLYLTLSVALEEQMQLIYEDETLNVEEKQKEMNMIYIQFMDDMDDFLAIRVSDDLGSLASSSSLYMTYIALLQNYCELYQSEKEKLIENFNFSEDESEKYPSVQALSMVESFYLGLIEE